MCLSEQQTSYIHPPVEQGGGHAGLQLIHTEDQSGVTTSLQIHIWTVNGASKATQTQQLDLTAESGSWSGCV